GCGDLVLHNLDLHSGADHFFAFFDLRHAANVDAHRGVELEGAATAGGLWVAEHHTDLFADLVDEDQACSGLGDDAGELPQGLRHQPRLQSHLHIAHLAFELGARNERGHGVDDDQIDGARADKDFSDLQGLFAAVGLRDEEV